MLASVETKWLPIDRTIQKICTNLCFSQCTDRHHDIGWVRELPHVPRQFLFLGARSRSLARYDTAHLWILYILLAQHISCWPSTRRREHYRGLYSSLTTQLPKCRAYAFSFLIRCSTCADFTLSGHLRWGSWAHDIPRENIHFEGFLAWYLPRDRQICLCHVPVSGSDLSWGPLWSWTTR